MHRHGDEGVGRIRVRRGELGLSQEALARKAECSVHYLALLERGYRPATSDVLPRILQVLANDVAPADNGRDEKHAEATAHDES